MATDTHQPGLQPPAMGKPQGGVAVREHEQPSRTLAVVWLWPRSPCPAGLWGTLCCTAEGGRQGAAAAWGTASPPEQGAGG